MLKSFKERDPIDHNELLRKYNKKRKRFLFGAADDFDDNYDVVNDEGLSDSENLEGLKTPRNNDSGNAKKIKLSRNITNEIPKTKSMPKRTLNKINWGSKGLLKEEDDDDDDDRYLSEQLDDIIDSSQQDTGIKYNTEKPKLIFKMEEKKSRNGKIASDSNKEKARVEGVRIDEGKNSNSLPLRIPRGLDKKQRGERGWDEDEDETQIENKVLKKSIEDLLIKEREKLESVGETRVMNDKMNHSKNNKTLRGEKKTQNSLVEDPLSSGKGNCLDLVDSDKKILDLIDDTSNDASNVNVNSSVVSRFNMGKYMGDTSYSNLNMDDEIDVIKTLILYFQGSSPIDGSRIKISETFTSEEQKERFREIKDSPHPLSSSPVDKFCSFISKWDFLATSSPFGQNCSFFSAKKERIDNFFYVPIDLIPKINFDLKNSFEGAKKWLACEVEQYLFKKSVMTFLLCIKVGFNVELTKPVKHKLIVDSGIAEFSENYSGNILLNAKRMDICLLFTLASLQGRKGRKRFPHSVKENLTHMNRIREKISRSHCLSKISGKDTLNGLLSRLESSSCLYSDFVSWYLSGQLGMEIRKKFDNWLSNANPSPQDSFLLFLPIFSNSDYGSLESFSREQSERIIGPSCHFTLAVLEIRKIQIGKKFSVNFRVAHFDSMSHFSANAILLDSVFAMMHCLAFVNIHSEEGVLDIKRNKQGDEDKFSMINLGWQPNGNGYDCGYYLCFFIASFVSDRTLYEDFKRKPKLDLFKFVALKKLLLKLVQY